MSASTDSGRPMRAALRLAVVAALLLPAAAAAQSTLGTIRGTVTDPQKQVVAGAAVLITDQDTGVPRVADTNSVGDYEVPNLRAGNYRVEINAPNLKPYRVENVVLRAGETLRVDAALTLAGATEDVTVTAAPGPIQLESQAVTGGVTAKQLDNLPRSSRDFQDFLYLSPNIVGDVGRQRLPVPRRPHLRRVVHPGRPALHRRHLRQHRQRRAGPRLDRGSAGALELLQRGIRRPRRRGRHDAPRHGQVPWHGLLRLQRQRAERAHVRADASPASNATIPLLDTSRNRWGATLGGPIIKNRTFFFGAYDGSQSKSSAFSHAGDGADGSDAQRQLLRRELHRPRSADRTAVPEQHHPRQSHPSLVAQRDGLLPIRCRT